VSIDRDAETSRWQQLAALLRSQIQFGELPPGRIMPSETTLMQEHGLARGTVRKAIDAFAQEGLVNRVQGRGTFLRRKGTGLVWLSRMGNSQHGGPPAG
jgi:DNA-binding GntR family transcriptional regulator